MVTVLLSTRGKRAKLPQVSCSNTLLTDIELNGTKEFLHVEGEVCYKEGGGGVGHQTSTQQREDQGENHGHRQNLDNLFRDYKCNNFLLQFTTRAFLRHRWKRRIKIRVRITSPEEANTTSSWKESTCKGNLSKRWSKKQPTKSELCIMRSVPRVEKQPPRVSQHYRTHLAQSSIIY